jgi:hypothetical protein
MHRNGCFEYPILAVTPDPYGDAIAGLFDPFNTAIQAHIDADPFGLIEQGAPPSS